MMVLSTPPSETEERSLSAGVPTALTVFVCANCARIGQLPDPGGQSRPAASRFGWPSPAHEVLVPCTGRIQPEHVLKAFESGASLVCVVACQEDNCHYLEGSRRCARRIEHVRAILDEVGLGSERLLLFHLPGSAAEDTALGAGATAPTSASAEAPGKAGTEGLSDELLQSIASIRGQALAALDRLPPNPLRLLGSRDAAEAYYQEVDTSDDDSE
jgi:coenzyme F420-reducing hydrogenase delta subunit